MAINQFRELKDFNSRIINRKLKNTEIYSLKRRKKRDLELPPPPPDPAPRGSEKTTKTITKTITQTVPVPKAEVVETTTNSMTVAKATKMRKKRRRPVTKDKKAPRYRINELCKLNTVGFSDISCIGSAKKSLALANCKQKQIF